MWSVCLNVRVYCAVCASPVAVGGAVPKVLCERCEAVNEIKADRWESIFRTAVEDVLAPGKPTLSLTVGLGAGQLDAEITIKDPVFPGSSEPFPIEAGAAQASNGYTFDPTTGERASLRLPDDSMALQIPTAAFLFGEDESQLAHATDDFTTFRLPAAEKPLEFRCTECGAEFMVDGTSRQVRCEFCKALSDLPNDLWAELHPARTHSWWMILEERNPFGESDAAAAPTDTGRSELEACTDIGSVWMTAAFEAETTCGKCGATLPINALVPKLACLQCGTVARVPKDLWNDLGDQLSEWVASDRERTGLRTIKSSGSMTGRRKGVFDFAVLRDSPKGSDGRVIEATEAMAAIEKRGLREKETGRRLGVRRMPEGFGDGWSEVKCLVGEAEEQLPGWTSGFERFPLPKAEKPVSYRCPHCGGALELDGRVREVTCHYCSDDFSVPPKVWAKLHPPVKWRWWAFMDVKPRPLSWANDVQSVVTDENGNSYLLCRDSGLMLAAVDPALMPIWVRRGVEEEFDLRNRDPELAITADKKLVLRGRGREALVVFDVSNGELLSELGGAGRNQPRFAECRSFAADTDGTLLCMFDIPDDNTGGAGRLERWTLDGERRRVWSGSGSIGGKLGGLIRRVSGMATRVDQLGNRPEVVSSSDVKLGVAWDGSVLLTTHGIVYRYDPEGRLIRRTEVEGAYPLPAQGDTSGNTFLVAGDPDTGIRIIRLPPDGTEPLVFAKGKHVGGVMQYEQTMTVRPDGSVALFDSDSQMRVLDPDGNLDWTSKKSAERDRR